MSNTIFVIFDQNKLLYLGTVTIKQVLLRKYYVRAFFISSKTIIKYVPGLQ